MTYKTQFGDVPTHRLPEADGGPDAQRYIVRIEEGQSVPRWGSTKHLQHGPLMYLRQGFEVTSFDLPETGKEHEAIRESLPTDAFRDDEHFASFSEATPVLDLVDNT